MPVPPSVVATDAAVIRGIAASVAFAVVTLLMLDFGNDFLYTVYWHTVYWQPDGSKTEEQFALEHAAAARAHYLSHAGRRSAGAAGLASGAPRYSRRAERMPPPARVGGG